jgi:hypothetical protein
MKSLLEPSVAEVKVSKFVVFVNFSHLAAPVVLKHLRPIFMAKHHCHFFLEIILDKIMSSILHKTEVICVYRQWQNFSVTYSSSMHTEHRTRCPEATLSTLRHLLQR